jgi:hypothetical protein
MDHILFNTAVSAAKIPVALDDMRGYVWQSWKGCKEPSHGLFEGILPVQRD